MFDYLSKYNSLPEDLRSRISAPGVLAGINELEKKYSVSLASLVMRVMIKEVNVHELDAFLVEEMNMPGDPAGKLATELRTKVFSAVGDYLGLAPASPPPVPLPAPSPHPELNSWKKFAPKAVPEKERIEVPLNDVPSAPPRVADMPPPLKVIPGQPVFAPTHPVPADNAQNDLNKLAAQAASHMEISQAQYRSRKQDNQNVSSNFFFSPEDEEEIRELTRKIEFFTQSDRLLADIDEKLSRLKNELQISFSSEALNDRFHQVIVTYLKGIRKKIETKETLIKPANVGGLNLSEKTVDQIMFLIEEQLMEDNSDVASKVPPAVSSPPSEIQPLKKPAIVKEPGLRDVDYDFGALIKRQEAAEADRSEARASLSSGPASPSVSPTAVAAEKDEPKKAALDPAPASAPAPVPSPVKSPKVISIRQPLKEKAGTGKFAILDTAHELEAPRPTAALPKISTPDQPAGSHISVPLRQANMRRPLNVDTAKQKLEDVKYIPKIMGPIEELKYLDLVNFRRLSAHPDRAVMKIREKINFLEEENFNKKIEAIKAWRLSPIYKIYLEIGHESISQKAAISDVIDTRKRAGQEYLTPDEFDAIMDLNRSLRF